METYIIAVKRDQRAVAPKVLADAIEAIEGVEVLSASTPAQVQIQASYEGLERVRASLGRYCHIEPVISHRPL